METKDKAVEGSAEVTKEVAAPVVKAPGIGDVAKQLIRDGLGNKEVLDKVKEQFPDAKTTMASINWYRNNLRDTEDGIKTARELSSAGKPSSAEAKAAKEAAKAAEKAEKDAKKAAEKAEATAKKDAEKAEAKAKKDAEKAEAKAKKDAEKAEAKKAAAPAATAPAGDLAAALA